MSQSLKALILLLLALPGLILAPGSAFVVCLCDSGAVDPAAASCCQAAPSTAPSAATVADCSGETGCGKDCDSGWFNPGCCGDAGDCAGCLEFEVDDLLLATVDGPCCTVPPAVLMAISHQWAASPRATAMLSGPVTRPPPPVPRLNAGLLPGVRPLRI